MKIYYLQNYIQIHYGDRQPERSEGKELEVNGLTEKLIKNFNERKRKELVRENYKIDGKMKKNVLYWQKRIELVKTLPINLTLMTPEVPGTIYVSIWHL